MATQAKRDLYQILGVAPTASEQDIKDVFDRLVAEFHASGKPKSIDDVEWLRQVLRAHDILSDGERRKHYDRTGEDTIVPANPAPGYPETGLEQMARSVEQEMAFRRSVRIAHWLGWILGR